MTRLELIDYVEQELAAFPGKASLLMMDLTRGTELLNHGGDTPLPAAHTIALPILMTVLDLAARNELTVDQTVRIPPAAGSTVFEAENDQGEYTLLELLEWMLVQGDEAAAGAVLERIGTDAVNGFCQRVGATQTRLDLPEGGGLGGVTTARDQFMLYSLLSWCAKRDTFWQEGMELLYRQRRQDLFLRWLCGPLSLAHVPGEGAGLAHDAGLFMNAENPFYLGVFTWDGPGGEEQKRLVARLAKAAYRWRMGY